MTSKHRVSSQFFERQDSARRYTRWLLAGFIAAILVVTLVINLVVLWGLAGDPAYVLMNEPWMVAGVSAIVVGTIMIACWRKSSQLRSGGAAVARALGGVQVESGDGDLARQRLLNVVEEMAIAARIRKPQVFVLPDEPGINAFAAGHSPDEAVVAVTQGALDKFDREQLQAVIGHEFSHILNGDMAINMRLTAWLFGLLVITDLAKRMMRGRSGKSAARLKIMALGVFAAGSVGLVAGKLLQAAVSRRREHLADASSVQFTRNPQALQSAFVIMAAASSGTALQHEDSPDVAHMFFAGSDVSWASRFGGSWFATHPPLEERVRALDSRVSKLKFKQLVREEQKRLAARFPDTEKRADAISGAAPAAEAAGVSLAAPAKDSMTWTGPAPLAAIQAAAAGRADTSTSAPPTVVPDGAALSMVETLPSGVRLIGGKSLPPDVLRNRLSQEQQHSIVAVIALAEKSLDAMQAYFITAMLAADGATSRMQLARLAPTLGIELMREIQAQMPRFAALAPAARMPLLSDLLQLLDRLDDTQRKRLRGIARAFAPTVAPTDMLRFAVTRLLDRRLARGAKPDEVPVPLTGCVTAISDLYAALAQCRHGAGQAGHNAYRAGLMGMLPPQQWPRYPDELVSHAALDAALVGLAQLHPTGKRSLSEGMARVIAVGARLTVSQVDLLRGTCLIVGCPTPLIPVDVVFDEADAGRTRTIQNSAR